jgi:hypothetical protein
VTGGGAGTEQAQPQGRQRPVCDGWCGLIDGVMGAD